ncbi:MAG: type IV pilus secretin PilQ [Polyangiaceae bacterium]|nr:type IV pilus secretin PilQ [Polyangiaceae bacterium]
MWKTEKPPWVHRAAALFLLVAVALFAPVRVRAGGNVHVKKVSLATPMPGAATVSVYTSALPTFSARVANGGTRILVDITDAGVDLTGADAAIVTGNDVVSGVMTQAYEQDGQHIARVLVQLAKPAEYEIRADASGLTIALAKSDTTKPKETARTSKTIGTDSKVLTTTAVGGPAIGDVRFEHAKGLDRVAIDLSGSPSFSELPSEAGKSIIEITGATLPDALQKKLDTTAFGGPVTSVSVYRRKSDATKVVIEVERPDGAKSSVHREEKTLYYSFTAASPAPATNTKDPAPAAKHDGPKSRTIAREEGITDIPKVEQTFSFAAGTKESVTEPDQADAFLPALAGQQKRYSGKRVDLDLRDADIHNVLRLLADTGKVNIVTSDEVKGNVTIRLRNVPWDQALETILQAKGLGMVRQGNMIRIAPLADLNKERELAIARRKSELQLAPLETRLIPVSYANAEDLMARAKDLLSPRGSIAVDQRTNVLIARDVAGNLNQVEELVNSLDTQTPQVLIEARIVEATSRYQRDIGIQWGGDATFGPATGNPTGLAFPSSIGIVGGASDQQTPTAGLSPFRNNVPNPNFAVNLPATVGTDVGGALGLAFGSINNTVNLAVRLSAAEASGMLRIISSPRILTLDNREARISQGTLIPFSQISAQGVQTTFQEAKLQLLVKPHVTQAGSVAMHVRINRDEPDFNQTSARGEPTILKREAETDLLVLDGHTAVIGGIFTRNTGRNLDQVPLLGDIPILGVLFQRRRSNDARSELVIFLTPRIVNRAEALGR